MKKRVTTFLLAVLLLCVPVALISWGGDFPLPGSQQVWEGAYPAMLSRWVSDSLPLQGGLRQLSLRLGLVSGQLEQNDIFISKDGLIKNIDAANPVLVQRNMEAILRFAAETELSTYLTIIPTSSAILQEQLPPYAQIYNNQKTLIDDIYRQMSGQVTVVDVYSLLFNKRDQYLYYRTESNLTALGGYYVYTALGGRMTGQEVQDYGQFNIEYLSDGYYGDLFARSPYQGVEPDILSLYRYSRFDREYLVTHQGPDGLRQYHTLYPTHLSLLGREMEVYLGGMSAVTTVRTDSPYARSLLVFGDKTALSYLPFLANHYERITLVDLFQLTQEVAEGIDLQRYDQALFAYSVESFDSDIPLRAERLLT